MQIDSEGEDEMQSRTEGEKDRAKDNNQVIFYSFNNIKEVTNTFILITYVYFKVQDMEEDSSDEDDVSPPGDTHKSKEPKPRDSNNMQPPPLPPTPGNVVVKKGYDPKQHCK